MTLEITPGQSAYSYRLRPGSRIIEFRFNRKYMRWHPWRVFDTPTEAKAALLAIETATEPTITGAEEPTP